MWGEVMKCLVSLVLIVMCLVLVGSAVYAAGTYSLDISVTDNTSTDRVVVPALIPFSSLSAVSLGMMGADGLDTRVFEGTSPLDYMIADDRIGVLFPALDANQQREIRLETGYDPPNPSFGIITGTGGYFTVPDTLTESGNNFRVKLYGVWLNAVAGPDKVLFSHYDAVNGGIKCIHSPTVPGEIVTSISVLTNTAAYRPNAAGSSAGCSPSAGENYACSGDNNDATYVYRISAAYQIDLYNIPNHTTETGIIKSLTIYIRVQTVAGTGYATTYMRTGSTNYPGDEKTITSTSPDNTQVYVLNPKTTAAWTWDDIDNLEIGVSLKGDGTNQIRSKEVWAIISYLKETEVSVTVPASAKYDIEVVENGAGNGFWMTVGTSTSANVTAVSVPNSSAPWIFCSSNTTPYVGSVEYWVSGGLVAEYQPTAIITRGTPSFVAAGAVAHAANGNVTPALPAGWISNDIFIATVASLDNIDSTLPAGWTAIDAGTNNGAGFRFTAYWRRAVAGDVAPLVTHAAGSGISAVVVAYRGCIAGGSPIDVVGATSVNTPASTTLTFSAGGITTTERGDLVVALGGIAGTSLSNSYTGTPVPTERVDGPNTAARPEVVVADFIQAAAGSTGSRVSTITSFLSNGILVSFKAAHVLPDGEGTSHGSIVWGSNNQLVLELGGLQSILSHVSESSETAGPPSVYGPPASLPSENVTENTTRPFYELFKPAADSLGWPSINLYGVMAIFGAIGIGVGVAVATGSGMLAVIGVLVGLIAGAGMEVFGWWVVVAYVLFGLAFLGATRSL